MTEEKVLLQATDVRQVYGKGSNRWEALKGVSINLRNNESIGIIGLSGCGKSTLLRILAGLEAPLSGDVLFHGKKIDFSSRESLRQYHSKVQMVFQSPMSTFSPYMTIQTYLLESLRSFGGLEKDEREQAAALLAQVELSGNFLDRLPHQLSGGQLQRVVIAGRTYQRFGYSYPAGYLGTAGANRQRTENVFGVCRAQFFGCTASYPSYLCDGGGQDY